MKPIHIRIHPLSALLGGLLVVCAGLLMGMQNQAELQSSCLTHEQAAILSHMSLVRVPDGVGNKIPTLLITGVNVQVVNGLGATATTNGAGNIIVGYNEFGNVAGDTRIGSHNLVTGRMNNFWSFGGLIAGYENTISGQYCSVLGGSQNFATFLGASVAGGIDNRASGHFSAIAGGTGNQTTSYASAVGGGADNLASGTESCVSGGWQNTASNNQAWVAGGFQNEAGGLRSSVSGGLSNRALGNFSSVSGGYGRSAVGDHDWVAGSLLEDS